jgi:hypothetical protein
VTSATGAGSFKVTLKITSADNSRAAGHDHGAERHGRRHADVPVYEFYDHTLRHRISGLKPATVYYYQFTAGSGVSRVGRFKTAPAADADISALNFAFISCQDWSVNHWAGLDALAQENVDFIVHLGDYIYEAVGADFQAGGVESATRRWCCPTARPAHRRQVRDHAGRLPLPLQALPHRPPPAEPARALRLRRHLGRPRVQRRLLAGPRDLRQRHFNATTQSATTPPRPRAAWRPTRPGSRTCRPTSASRWTPARASPASASTAT